MNVKEIAWLVCRVVTGILCMFVSMRGLYAFWAIDLRADTILSVLFCALPTLSIVVFLFARLPWPEVSLHAAIAFGYLATYSALNWRTCAALGYCGSVRSTILETARTHPAEAAFGVMILAAAAICLDDRRTRQRTAVAPRRS